MLDQERIHLETFNTMVSKYAVRPTILRPLWHIAGVALGAGTALLGKEAAMACTEAVETVIGQHYNDQLREVLMMEQELKQVLGEDEVETLKRVIKKFRDEELEHLDHAVQEDAQKVRKRI